MKHVLHTMYKDQQFRKHVVIMKGNVVNFKGDSEVSREFDVISKPKNVCLSTETMLG